MARKKDKIIRRRDTGAWLITFSDLTTLLLTFFILLLSMSSMDTTVLARVNVFTNNLSIMTYQGAGKVPSRIRLLIELIEDPFAIMEKTDRFKDLLFPDDVIPPEIDRKTMLENITVLADPEGVALSLTDALMFESGSTRLTREAEVVLSQVSRMLTFATPDVVISGHTDSTQGTTTDNYTLSAERALSILDYFTKYGLVQQRFSLAGYGPNVPLEDNATPEGRAKNRRVDILMKTRPRLAGY